MDFEAEIKRILNQKGLEEIRRHASVSIRNRCWCNSCFCCACAEFMSRNTDGFALLQDRSGGESKEEDHPETEGK